MAKMVWNQIELDLPAETVEQIKSTAESMGMTTEELLTDVLMRAVESSPEIAAIYNDAQAEVNKRGITLDQYIAEAEGAQYMTDLIIRLAKLGR